MPGRCPGAPLKKQKKAYNENMVEPREIEYVKILWCNNVNLGTVRNEKNTDEGLMIRTTRGNFYIDNTYTFIRGMYHDSKTQPPFAGFCVLFQIVN